VVIDNLAAPPHKRQDNGAAHREFDYGPCSHWNLFCGGGGFHPARG
jgi:hypothetical protein